MWREVMKERVVSIERRFISTWKGCLGWDKLYCHIESFAQLQIVEYITYMYCMYVSWNGYTNTSQSKISWCVWIIYLQKTWWPLKEREIAHLNWLILCKRPPPSLHVLDPCLLHGTYHPISTQTELAGICELSRKAVDIWAGAYGSEAHYLGV